MISRLLVIDDDAALCRSLQLQLETKGCTTAVAGTAEAGLLEVDAETPDLVLLDINLPDESGLSVLQKISERDQSVPVVMVTARQDMHTTITAMRSGAFDYIRKPFDIDDVLLVIEKLERRQAPDVRFPPATDAMSGDAGPREIIGSDAKMLDVLKQIGLLSRSRVGVMIKGESGTGKELVARALHEATCSGAPFVAVNCSAVVPTLLESELFGHERGAFTGADRQKVGKLEHAGAGTLFFDEIGDMDLDLQAKLLRVLQEREFERVGGLQPIAFQARVVCATHRDLSQMVASGEFREDLLYRIAVSELMVPPLRERRGDIRLLVRHFLGKLGMQLHKRVESIDESAMLRLEQYDWPGNVRELENVLARATALARSSTLMLDDIGFASGNGVGSTEADEPIRPLAEAEMLHIEKALLSTGWNITQTAQLLQISPTTLRKKIADSNLQPY
ncbi:MAG: sigma-54-dependent Fis family transcriptional regulator [Lentisphaerae bacterium]|nr:sigma-54-dependent Fis family transcriptional regulator [Lentisphaerota bacterium]